MRKIIPGGADRSYGIQVAKLAGVPEKVIERAKEIARLKVKILSMLVVLCLLFLPALGRFCNASGECFYDDKMRLSALATNVLNLSRIENQTILGPKSRFNLSEQIRSCILLLERKAPGSESGF